ncbi:putative ubx domain containing protein [Fasciola hepatica]|uniref:Ubx domain containing protein n=1 Tax=Fasciola hepatica TaxID=6192 RepID=A0A4E0R329_FASHE|nr:putative ubx domain containing protein [Fasciola hepatica]
MTERADLISKLCNISGLSAEESEHLLEAFQWDYAEAVRAHFDADDYPDHAVAATAEVSQSNVESAPNKTPKREQKIITLDALRTASPEGPEEGQAFYVGGSETGGGGQQVLGPPRKNAGQPLPDPSSAPDEFVHRLFQAAKGQGAEVLDTERYKERSDKKRIYVPFSGTGYKLGEDPTAPSVVAQGPGTSRNTHSTADADQSDEHSVVVKMWRDGFSLDDGPLRSYNDPASRSFLEDIQAGTVPQVIGILCLLLVCIIIYH